MTDKMLKVNQVEMMVGITGITILTLIPVVFIAPFILVAVVAFLGQAYFTGKDLKDDFKKSILRGPNRRR